MVQLIRFVLAVIGAFIAIPLMTFAFINGVYLGAFATQVQADDDEPEQEAAADEPTFADTDQPASKPGEPMLDPQPSVDARPPEQRRRW